MGAKGKDAAGWVLKGKIAYRGRRKGGVLGEPTQKGLVMRCTKALESEVREEGKEA